MQDAYDMKAARPSALTVASVPGISTTHRFRVRFDRDGKLVLSSKRWMSDANFNEEQVWWRREKLHELTNIEIAVIDPEWPKGFVNEALHFVDRFESTLQAQGKEVNYLNEVPIIYRRELAQYLPTGKALSAKLAFLRSAALPRPTIKDSGAVSVVSGMAAAAASAFPGS